MAEMIADTTDQRNVDDLEQRVKAALSTLPTVLQVDEMI